MRLEALDIAGAFRLVPQPISDSRGFFARTVCADELEAQHLIGRFAQSSISVNSRRGTVRGMHYSAAPHAETKLVRCTAGAICDILADVRPNSPTFRRSVTITLSAETREAVYVPAGVAHGFQTLRDDSEVLYMIDVPYAAESARGFRWNDSAFAIRWAEPVTMISSRDLAYPDWIDPTP